MLLLGALWLAAATPARADHGGVQAQALIDLDGRYGAAVLADALWLDGPVRLGVSLATGALSNGGGEQSIVIGLAAPVLWLGQPGDGGVFGSLRVGGFAGGRKGGFLGGLWVSPVLGYRISLGGRAALRLCAEGFLLRGERTDLIVSPGIGLEF